MSINNEQQAAINLRVATPLGIFCWVSSERLAVF